MAERKFSLRIILKMKVVDVSLIAIVFANLQTTTVFRVDF
jgi:hypothetical protein